MENTGALKKLASEAVDVQNACNLLGVSKSFSRAVQDLWESGAVKDAEELSRHPVVTLWVDKLVDMNKRPSLAEFSSAWDWAKKMTEPS